MTGTLAAILGSAALLGASARWNWWRPRVKGIPALMYHKIGDCPRGSGLRSLWVRARDFRRQLSYLKEHGYLALTFSELARAEAGELPMPERPVLLTFDDGYANNYELAFPILRETGLKANVFLVLETIGRHNAWHDPGTEPWLRMLTWDQVREMQDSGLVEFGSHAMRHPNLTRIPLEEARWEIAESKRRLEEGLGRSVLAFAYPYGAGAYVPEIRALARQAGYRYDFGIRQGISPLPWDPASGPLKRLLIRADDTLFDFHLNMTRGRARF